MKPPLYLLLVTLMICRNGMAQSVLDPTDQVVSFGSGTVIAQPPFDQIGKWGRTRRVSWNTDSFKCYIYKGVAFRLRFPKTYHPISKGEAKYPLLIALHGVGEAGPVTDNEYQLFHGGDVMNAAVDSGIFEGYLLFMQSTGGWGQKHFELLKEIIDYMVVNNQLDPFRICVNGYSSGGFASWDMSLAYPGYVSASLPISGTSFSFTSSGNVSLLKFKPIWNFQGALDAAPDAGTAHAVLNVFKSAGANLTYKEYDSLGHDCWDSAWKEPAFWPFVKGAYASNPWALFGRTQFPRDSVINCTIGVSPGYDEYQWRRNKMIIPGNGGNFIPVIQPGSYDCRVRKGNLWSVWSPVPVVISVM